MGSQETIGELSIKKLKIIYFYNRSSVLASGVVSASLQCRTGKLNMCPTDDLMLMTPVLITIQHSQIIEVIKSLITQCHPSMLSTVDRNPILANT